MKYSVGQKVKIHSLEWYRDNVNRYGIIECGKYEFFEPMNEYCGKVVTIKRIDDYNYRIDADKGAFCWTDEMIEGLVEEEKSLCEGCCSLELKYNKLTIADNICTDEVEIILQDYELKQRGDKWFAVKKKKEYPKTYEECYQVTGLLKTSDIYGYKNGLLFELQKLLIACDAYWKIAGEEMGLGKSWEPDFDNLSTNLEYIKIVKGCFTYSSRVLVFPTEEMRDAFYENFKEEIEQCKELL